MYKFRFLLELVLVYKGTDKHLWVEKNQHTRPATKTHLERTAPGKSKWVQKIGQDSPSHKAHLFRRSTFHPISAATASLLLKAHRTIWASNCTRPLWCHTVITGLVAANLHPQFLCWCTHVWYPKPFPEVPTPWPPPSPYLSNMVQATISLPHPRAKEARSI